MRLTPVWLHCVRSEFLYGINGNSHPLEIDNAEGTENSKDIKRVVFHKA